MSRMSGRRDAGPTVVATAVVVVCVLPVFLTGGMVTQLREDLALDVSAIGVAMSAFVAAQALCSRSLGRRADRIGAAAALRIATGIALASSVLLATLVTDVVGLTVALSLAGVANALGQPAASRLLSRVVGERRQGLVFGIYQSSKPIAGLQGGLAVPAIALTVGWRWAYAVAAVATVLLLVHLLRSPAEDASEGRTPPPVASDRPRAAGARPTLDRSVRVPLLIGAALGFGAVKVFATFVVDGGVEAGLSPATAGLVLSAASALAVASRLTVGLVADRRSGHQLGMVAAMLGVGSLGFVLLALSRPGPVVAGALVVAAGAWGYNGLFYLSVTRLLTAAPGTITGLVLSSSSVGGVLAPLAFGLVVDRWSYTVGWGATAAWGLVAAGMLRVAHLRTAAPTTVPATGGS